MLPPRRLLPYLVIAAAFAPLIAQTSDDDVDAHAAPAVRLRFMDQRTKAPLAGARLTIRRDRERTEAVTDARGGYRLEVPEPVALLEVRVQAEGHVGARQRWQQQNGRLDLPATFALGIPRGVRVGGQVVNEEGEPVEGAVVRVTAYGTPSFPEAYVRGHAATTDGNGQWTTDPILPADAGEFRIGVAHPDYISHVHTDSASTSVRYGGNTQPSVGDLYDGSARLGLMRGITVRGRVVDASGRPIPDTTVAQETRATGRPLPATRTSADGTFQFQTWPESITVVVHPEGHAPTAVAVDVVPNLEPFTLRVEPGAVLRGRVVGPDGAPIPRAIVGIETSHGDDAPKVLPWNTSTDPDGRFAWRSAPHEPAFYTVLKDGFVARRGVSLVADDEEHVLELVPAQPVGGAATAPTEP